LVIALLLKQSLPNRTATGHEEAWKLKAVRLKTQPELSSCPGEGHRNQISPGYGYKGSVLGGGGSASFSSLHWEGRERSARPDQRQGSITNTVLEPWLQQLERRC